MPGTSDSIPMALVQLHDSTDRTPAAVQHEQVHTTIAALVGTPDYDAHHTMLDERRDQSHYLRFRLDTEDAAKSDDARATACAIFKSHAIDALAAGVSMLTLGTALDELVRDIRSGHVVLSSRSE